MIILGVIGGPEIVIVALIVLLLFGGKKLPELMKGLGKGINEFKKATNSIKEEIESVNPVSDIKKEINDINPVNDIKKELDDINPMSDIHKITKNKR